MSADAGWRHGAGRRWLLVLVGIFALSRVVYALAGIHFDVLPLQGYWQYIDPELLRDDLFRSLWYQHSQPPLYNLLLGLVLDGGGRHAAGVFHLVYLGAGLTLTVSLYLLVTELGVAPRRAALAVGVLVASPPMVLYETWLYVEYLVAALLVVAALAALRFARHGHTRSAVTLFAAVAAIVASRTLFHLGFLVLVIALVAYLQPHRRRQVLVAAVLPLALVGAVYVKNFVLYGQLTSTSCAGLNAARITTHQLSHERRTALIEDGTLSRYAGVSPFAVPHVRPQDFDRPPTGVPLLDRPLKSTGAPNFDAKAYLPICRAYLRDAGAVARAEPVTLLRAVRQSALVFFRPTADYFWFQEYRADEMRRLRFVDRAYDLLVWGQPFTSHGAGPAGFTWATTPRRLLEVGWFVVAAYVFTLVGTARRLRTLGRTGRRTPEGLVLALTLLVVGYVGLVGNLFEAGENNRFRLLLDPLVLILLLVLTRSWPRRTVP